MLPKKEVSFHLRLPGADIQRFRKAADRAKITLADWARRALDQMTKPGEVVHLAPELAQRVRVAAKALGKDPEVMIVELIDGAIMRAPVKETPKAVKA